MFRERLRRVTGEADKVAIANQVARGELLEPRELSRVFAEVAEAMVGIIENSGLSREDQVQIRKNLSSSPVIIQSQARSQDKRRGPGTNGAHHSDNVTMKPKRGRPKKRESTETTTD